MKLRYTRTALSQLDAALAYVAEHSPSGAAGLRERIGQVEALLAAHPLAGQATDRQGVRRLGLTPYPYTIFYRVNSDDVIVMRMRHAASIRNLGDG